MVVAECTVYKNTEMSCKQSKTVYRIAQDGTHNIYIYIVSMVGGPKNVTLHLSPLFHALVGDQSSVA